MQGLTGPCHVEGGTAFPATDLDDEARCEVADDLAEQRVIAAPALVVGFMLIGRKGGIGIFGKDEIAQHEKPP